MKTKTIMYRIPSLLFLMILLLSSCNDCTSMKEELTEVKGKNTVLSEKLDSLSNEFNKLEKRVEEQARLAEEVKKRAEAAVIEATEKANKAFDSEN